MIFVAIIVNRYDKSFCSSHCGGITSKKNSAFILFLTKAEKMHPKIQSLT